MKTVLKSRATTHLPLPPGLNVPDVRRPDDGANAVSIVQERPGGFTKVYFLWMTYHAAAALGSCWPTHPDSGFFAASDLGSPNVLQLLARCSSVPRYRESARSRRMAVSPEERFEEIYAAVTVDVVVVAVIGSTMAVLLLLGC
jgi:hypothetical protein